MYQSYCEFTPSNPCPQAIWCMAVTRTKCLNELLLALLLSVPFVALISRLSLVWLGHCKVLEWDHAFHALVMVVYLPKIVSDYCENPGIEHGWNYFSSAILIQEIVWRGIYILIPVYVLKSLLKAYILNFLNRNLIKDM